MDAATLQRLINSPATRQSILSNPAARQRLSALLQGGGLSTGGFNPFLNSTAANGTVPYTRVWNPNTRSYVNVLGRSNLRPNSWFGGGGTTTNGNLASRLFGNSWNNTSNIWGQNPSALTNNQYMTNGIPNKGTVTYMNKKGEKTRPLPRSGMGMGLGLSYLGHQIAQFMSGGTEGNDSGMIGGGGITNNDTLLELLKARLSDNNSTLNDDTQGLSGLFNNTNTNTNGIIPGRFRSDNIAQNNFWNSNLPDNFKRRTNWGTLEPITKYEAFENYLESLQGNINEFIEGTNEIISTLRTDIQTKSGILTRTQNTIKRHIQETAENPVLGYDEDGVLKLLGNCETLESALEENERKLETHQGNNTRAREMFNDINTVGLSLENSQLTTKVAQQKSREWGASMFKTNNGRADTNWDRFLAQSTNQRSETNPYLARTISREQQQQ